MERKRTDPADERQGVDVEFAAPVIDIASRRMLRENPSDPRLRCVSSGYLSDGCSCRSSIPTSAVTDAWARERRAGVCGDRYFHFTWQGAVWLAYALRDGRIRGVYCPVHSAERDQRSLTEGLGEPSAQTIALTG